MKNLCTSTIRTYTENVKYVKRRLKEFKIKNYILEFNDDTDKWVFVFFESGNVIVKKITEELGGNFIQN